MSPLSRFALLAAIVLTLGGACRGQTGVCCNGATCTCVPATAEMCAAPNSFYLNGVCNPSPCTGRCCNATTCVCTIGVSPALCPAPNAFQCSGTCNPSPCFGKCCNAVTGACTVTSPFACATPSTFTCGSTCAVACPGVCCDFTGTCAGVQVPGCANAGTYLGLASTCTPTLCQSISTGVCCSITGTCTVTSPGQCPRAWRYGGCDSTACTNTPVGACCTGATCWVTYQSGCTEGTWAGGMIACNPTGGTPCCRADFNKTGGVTVQDIFDFLNTWFASSPTTDFDGDNTIAVADIFGFLNAWFAGC